MKLILKQLIIITSAFIIITWFQSIDDNKYKKIRNTFYDKYKFPILVSAIIGLLINLPEIISTTKERCQENITEITFITPKINDIIRPIMHENITDQQIYTYLPDF
jgi:hypothetical protein